MNSYLTDSLKQPSFVFLLILLIVQEAMWMEENGNAQFSLASPIKVDQ